MYIRYVIYKSDVKAIAKLYASGLSHAKIGAIYNVAGNTIRYHLRRQPHYRALVTKVLMYRVTHARGRALKHALDILRQRRPKVYERHILSGAPKLPDPSQFGRSWRCDCPKCLAGKTVLAMRAGDAWSWSCSSCGEAGSLPSRDAAKVEKP